MARSRNTGVYIAVAVFIVVAAVVRLFGGPIWNALLELHGRGASGH
jgi:hypothetical protein